MKKYILLTLLLASSLIYCGGDKQADNATDNPGSGGTVLAKVNNETLTLEDLKLQIPAEYREQLRGEDLKEAVETWINTQILANEGRKKGLADDHEVQAVIKFRSSDAIARRLIDVEVTQKTAVTPAEIDSAYMAEKDNYKVEKEQYRASHILIASKEEADAIYSRLGKGDDFAALARDYSVDRQSAANGGDIGYFTLDQIDPEFGKTVSKLQIGAFSPPVKTDYGFHIIKLAERLPAGSDINPEQVKGEISQKLLTNKQGRAFNALMDSLKLEAKIERFTPSELSIPAPPDSV